MFGLELAHGLGVFEPLAQSIDENRVEAVNRGAVFLQQVGGSCHGISQSPILSV